MDIKPTNNQRAVVEIPSGVKVLTEYDTYGNPRVVLLTSASVVQHAEGSSVSGYSFGIDPEKPVHIGPISHVAGVKQKPRNSGIGTKNQITRIPGISTRNQRQKAAEDLVGKRPSPTRRYKSPKPWRERS